MHPLILPLVGWSYGVALAQFWQLPPHGWGLVAAMSGIYAAYAWDRLMDSRRDGEPIPAARFVHLAVGGLTLLLAVFFHRPLLPAVAILAGMGIFYIPLKQVIPKNLLTALAWTVAVVELPFDGVPFTLPVILGVAVVFLTIYAAATLCDIPDVAEDSRAGVRGLSTRLGVQMAARVAGGIAAVAAIVAIVIGAIPLAVPAAVCCALGFGATGWLAREKASQFWVDALLILPGVLVVWGIF